MFLFLKNTKKKKSKNNQQAKPQKKKNPARSEDYLEKLCADKKKSKKEKELDAKVETYFRQRQTEDLFVLGNRLPGSCGSRQ